MTLTEFLLARIAEDEAVAQRWAEDVDGVAPDGRPWRDRRGRFIYAPRAHVLAECAAKRAIVTLHSAELGQHPDFCGHDLRALPCPTLRLLARPYAEHPDYDEAWWL